MLRRALIPAIVAAALTLMMTGCTSGKSSSGNSSDGTANSGPGTATTAETPPADSDSAGSSTVGTTSAGSSTSAGPTTSSGSAPSGVRACTAVMLQVDALRGSGVSQQQFATLTFTNKSGSTCSLAGYAGVQLLTGNAALGNPASPSRATVPAIGLAPGKQVAALLHGPSNCNAPVSTAVRITPPHDSGHVDRPLPMRACALLIDPFKAA